MAVLRSLRGDARGSVLTEYALTLPLFLALLLAVVDFGQIYFRWLMAEKATHLAARLAVVRPPACPGVPLVNERAGAAEAVFGMSCALAVDICSDPGSISCTGAEAVGDSFAEILAAVAPLLPGAPDPGALRFTYASAGLGFLGGPYVPLVTVELVGIEVPFLTPFGRLLGLLNGGAGGTLGPLALPAMRTTLPGEDLAEGGAG
jgi:hypothetical protein